jgi:hypothetical protein
MALSQTQSLPCPPGANRKEAGYYFSNVSKYDDFSIE